MIIDQAEIEINTHTSAQIIMLFAFLVFSSSPLDMRYIIPPIITAITAITAIYWISKAIIFPIISYTQAPDADALEHPGNPPHSTSGAAKPNCNNKAWAITKRNIYRNDFIF